MPKDNNLDVDFDDDDYEDIDEVEEKTMSVKGASAARRQLEILRENRELYRMIQGDVYDLW